MKKKNKKILNGVLLGMACALATGLVLQVTNVFDLFTEETPTEEPSEEVKLGTPVPNEGYIEKVYFNTNLSVEEVKNILDTLDIEQTPDEFGDVFGTYPILSNADQSKGIGLMKVDTEYFLITFVNNEQVIIFSSTTNEDCNAGWIDNSGVYEFNDTAIDIFATGIINQNEKLSSLISIKSFESEVN